MKLYDYNYFEGLTSFSGHMIDMETRGVTKSFNKAKNEAIKDIKSRIKELEGDLKSLNEQTEEPTFHRDEY